MLEGGEEDEPAIDRSLEYDQLLSQGQVLGQQCGTASKEASSEQPNCLKKALSWASVTESNNRVGSGVGRGSVIVEKTGTLGGTGIVGSAVDIHAHGAVAPGSGGAGALTLRDGLTLRGGSVLRLELGIRSDRVHIKGGTFAVSGNNGVTVSIADAGGLWPTTYTLIDFTGAGASGVEAGGFQLESGGPVRKATFRIKNNVLQVKIDAMAGPRRGKGH